MSEKKTISVMIPCYNEEQNARPIYEAVRDELVKSCPNYDYEILFIDNKSEDGTRAIIRQICAEDKHVKAIFNVKNFGQFNSPYYGMIHTSGDCTITMCADFQDPVEMIPRFVAEWEKGYKIVIGRKTQSKENPVMYWLRGCYYKLIKKMSSCEQIEQFTGFGLYDKSFIQTLRNLKDPTPFIRGIVAELGPERKEIEYTQPQRRAGEDPQQLVQPVRRRHAELYQLHQGRYAHCNVRGLPGGGAELSGRPVLSDCQAAVLAELPRRVRADDDRHLLYGRYSAGVPGLFG